jgi:hypothetical protein
MIRGQWPGFAWSHLVRLNLHRLGEKVKTNQFFRTNSSLAMPLLHLLEQLGIADFFLFFNQSGLNGQQ